MEISLAPEKVFVLTPALTPDQARERVDKKKVGLIAGTVGSLFSQPKPEEFRLLGTEGRLEPFWRVAASSHTSYERKATYTVPTSGPEVREVSLAGQTYAATPAQKGPSTLSLTVAEQCEQVLTHEQTFDAVSGAKADFQKYARMDKIEAPDLNQVAPQGVLLVPPQIRATAVVRQVTPEVIKSVSNAHVIHNERVDIEAIELYFRPVYAFEFEWAAKNKRMVIEVDGMTGDMRAGRKLADQIKNIVTRDLLFDVTADAVGIFVPGGSIAVKLVKAVVDRGR